MAPFVWMAVKDLILMTLLTNIKVRLNKHFLLLDSPCVRLESHTSTVKGDITGTVL